MLITPSLQCQPLLLQDGSFDQKLAAQEVDTPNGVYVSFPVLLACIGLLSILNGPKDLRMTIISPNIMYVLLMFISMEKLDFCKKNEKIFLLCSNTY